MSRTWRLKISLWFFWLMFFLKLKKVTSLLGFASHSSSYQCLRWYSIIKSWTEYSISIINSRVLFFWASSWDDLLNIIVFWSVISSLMMIWKLSHIIVSSLWIFTIWIIGMTGLRFLNYDALLNFILISV